MLTVVTLTLAKCKTSEKQSEKMIREKNLWPPALGVVSFVCLSILSYLSSKYINILIHYNNVLLMLYA